MLPLRALSQQLGYSVNWDQETRQIETSMGNRRCTSI
ncbi:stalk domain-containing protein [Zhenhengia yiwuensis]